MLDRELHESFFSTSVWFDVSPKCIPENLTSEARLTLSNTSIWNKNCNQFKVGGHLLPWPNGLSAWSAIEEKKSRKSNFTHIPAPRMSHCETYGLQMHLPPHLQCFPYPQLFLRLGGLLTVGMPNGGTWKDTAYTQSRGRGTKPCQNF